METKKQALKVLLSGGGTGGHIYPALALAKHLASLHSDVEFLYVGTQRGLESKLVPQAGLDFIPIKVEGFSRKFNFKSLKYNAKSLVYFLKALSKSKQIIKEFKPDVVVGTGGYVCAPVLYQAAKLGIPSLIHEQNSVAGVTNKFLARYVDKIALSFQEAEKSFAKYKDKLVLTGNPRGQEVSQVKGGLSLHKYGMDMSRPAVIIFGGSRGAYAINKAFVEAYSQLAERDYQVLFVPGSANYSRIKQEIDTRYGYLKAPNIFIESYIDNMPQVFKAIDLVVCRSGATTLAEIMSLGLASILIPSPNVTADHQTKNAMSLVNQQAAFMIKENDLNGQSLLDHLDGLMHDDVKRNKMAQQAKEMGQPQASDKLIALILSIVKEDIKSDLN